MLVLRIFVSEDESWSLVVGPTQDTEKDISALCQLWLDSRDLVVKVCSWLIVQSVLTFLLIHFRFFMCYKI